MPMCVAVNCKNRPKKGSGVTFHRFPHKESGRLKKWVRNVKRANWFPPKCALLCSEHFTEECFDRTGQNNRLRDTAFPTLFKFPAKENEEKSSVQGTKNKSRKKKMISPNECLSDAESDNDDQNNKTDIIAHGVKDVIDGELNIDSSQNLMCRDDGTKNTDTSWTADDHSYANENSRCESNSVCSVKNLNHFTKEQDHCYTNDDSPAVLKKKLTETIEILEKVQSKLSSEQRKSRRLKVQNKNLKMLLKVNANCEPSIKFLNQTWKDICSVQVVLNSAEDANKSPIEDPKDSTDCDKS